MPPIHKKPKPYWQSPDGEHVLYCADCMTILPLLGRVDAVVTDPPYGIGISSNPFRQKHAKMDWDDIPACDSTVKNLSLYDEAIIWGGNYFDLPPTQRFLVWDKVQPEDFSSAMVEMAWTNLTGPAKIYQRHVVSFEKFHPTTKPMELMKWCLTFTKGMRVLDPYAGSGTTGVAAISLGRKFIGIEISETYCAIAAKRLQNEWERMERLRVAELKHAKKSTLFNE